jgi:hypothetical protein
MKNKNVSSTKSQTKIKNLKIMKTMKKLAAMCLICVGTITMNAQNVGISATGIVPSGDAGLDVNFTDKGLLIPRVSLSSLTTYNPPITGGGPTTSMLIYNTNATIGTGYYYWDGSRWVKLITNGGTPSDAWLTLGNAGTTPGTHFLGTTDNVDLVFKTNNVEQMRITSAGNVGIGTSGPLSKIHSIGGAYFETGNSSSVNEGFVIKSHTTVQDQGGLFITNSFGFITGSSGNKAFKFVTNQTAVNGENLRMGWVDASNPNSFSGSKTIFIDKDLNTTWGWNSAILMWGGVIVF